MTPIHAYQPSATAEGGRVAIRVKTAGTGTGITSIGAPIEFDLSLDDAKQLVRLLEIAIRSSSSW